MPMNILMQVGVIPALLMALAGMIILRGEDEARSARRFLLFLLGAGVLILLALALAMRLISGNDPQLYFQLAWLSAPSLLGILALIPLYSKAGLAGMDHRTRISAGALGLAMIILFALSWNPQFGIEFFILPGALLLALGWALGRRWNWLAVVLGLMGLGMLVLFYYYMSHPPDYSAGPPPFFLMILFLLGYNIWPGLSVVMSGVLLTASLHTSDTHRPSRPARLFLAGLAIFLPLLLGYVIFWGSVWDHTSDGLYGIFLSQLSGLIAIGTGTLMMLALHGRSRLAGLFFMLVLPVMLNQSFEAGWRVSYHEITEARAARIARALDQFHLREGYYPESLGALTARDLSFIQQPVILAGEQWCYESGGNYYRLSAFYREFFSSPVSLRLYVSAGEMPTSPMPCEERLAAMKEKYYSPMEDPSAMQPPRPTPLPEIEVGIPKTEIQPVLEGAAALPGDWSADGSYFVFATQEDGLALHFLSGKTGEICTADGQYSRMDGLREHYAWLPDGRLLFIDVAGEIVVLVPCQAGSERLTDLFDVTFSQIGAYAPETGRILLQSESAYWILDGRALEAGPVSDVAPTPYELHWDRSVWLPGGERLVIARLNGRQGSNAGSTLYLIDGGTGDVLKSHFMEGDFGQSAPWIEALSDQLVLLHAQGSWLIVDFSVEPVKTTNVLEDIFGLDLKFPDEISAAGSHVADDANGYYLAVRLNHPRNQATYLYSSQTRRTYVYDHEHHTLLIFPDGYFMEMPKLETEPTYRDEYDLVMVDDPEAVQSRLILTGHTPREYPHLSLAYVAQRSQFAVASAHGVSLVSLLDGEMKEFWSLPGEGYSPWISAAPDDSALVAVKDFGGFYYIPLPPGK